MSVFCTYVRSIFLLFQTMWTLLYLIQVCSLGGKLPANKWWTDSSNKEFEDAKIFQYFNLIMNFHYQNTNISKKFY